MVFKRRYTKKRRTYRRMKPSLQKQINSLKRKTKEQRPQLQFNDDDGDSINIFSTPGVIKLAGSAQGRLTIKSIQMKAFINTSAEINTWFRVILFTDKSNEGKVIPTWGDLIEGANGVSALLGLRSIEPEENEGTRFKIIMDRKMLLNADENVGNDSGIFSFYKKLNLKSINKAGDAYWEAGGLYLAYMGNVATGESDLFYRSRIRFIEHASGA